MTASENYDKMRAFLNAFPKWVETKKDLLKVKDKTLVAKYYAYRKYFEIDKRLKPSSVVNEISKFKRTNIYFKSEELGIKLYKSKEFDEHDRYKASQKIIAKTTNAMLDRNIKLKDIHTEQREIYVRYNVKSNRKIVMFDTEKDNIEFMENLPDNYFINIGDTSYNKNGLDFIYDYHNSSTDFTNNLEDYIREENLFIYIY